MVARNCLPVQCASLISPDVKAWKGWGLGSETGSLQGFFGSHMSYSLNALQGVNIGDYIGDYYRGY